MKTAIHNHIFYHIYPLGMCGAPERNSPELQTGDGLRRLIDRIPHLSWLGINALYIGPLFESSAHGYDTINYYQPDRRLGSKTDLQNFVAACHQAGIAVVFDAVFNHTGRDFFAFKDLQIQGESSRYRNWYRNIDFSHPSPYGDAFSYMGWSGCHDLVTLDTDNPEVQQYFYTVLETWINDYKIDGIRLDAADVLSPGFMDGLSEHARNITSDFWLMGEVVHGDYRNWAGNGRLDSVTNYEVHKGLWSSFNDRNLFELAWSLNRQYGPDGIYRDLFLYNFLDNHDVNRIASQLDNNRLLPLLYGLLYTIPGIPSIYYGSEWGIKGKRTEHSDSQLRPSILETADFGKYSALPPECRAEVDSAELSLWLIRLAGMRSSNSALQFGTFRQLAVQSCQYAFSRSYGNVNCIVAVNIDTEPAVITLDTSENIGGSYRDAISGSQIEIHEAHPVIPLPGHSFAVYFLDT